MNIRKQTNLKVPLNLFKQYILETNLIRKYFFFGSFATFIGNVSHAINFTYLLLSLLFFEFDIKHNNVTASYLLENFE